MPLIRPAVDADGPAIAALLAAVFAEYEGCLFIPGEFPELAAPATHYRGRGGGLWVAEEAGAVVGSIALSRVDAGRAELHKLYVARGQRGTGLAATLHGIAIEAARASGARAIRLWSDTRFASGHRFYEKAGYRRLPVVRYLADASATWEFAYFREID